MSKDALSSWTRYKESNCKTCRAHCCTLPVEVNATDLIRLGLATQENCEESLKKVAKKLLKDKVIQDYRIKTGVFILSQRANNDCIYLDRDRRCTVYEQRPVVCREFPKTVGPKVGYCGYEKK